MYCLLHYEPTSSSATSSTTTTSTTIQQNYHHHHRIMLYFSYSLSLKTNSSQTLAEAIEVAGLGEALSGGSFTIFAPTGFIILFISEAVSVLLRYLLHRLYCSFFFILMPFLAGLYFTYER
jgi:hypothetical protein